MNRSSRRDDNKRNSSPLKQNQCVPKEVYIPQIGYPLKWTRKERSSFQPTPIYLKENYAEGLTRIDPDKLMREKPRKNKYCLPTGKEMQRRKTLYAEFDRMHNLAKETCDWLVSLEFSITNRDRRNLGALMKTCFDPLPFSSIGQGPKDVMLVPQERGASLPKPGKLSEKERFGHLDTGHVGDALRDYIKKRKNVNCKITKTPQNRNEKIEQERYGPEKSPN